MQIACVTTVFSSTTDPLHDPATPGNAKWVCYTDQPEVTSDVWEVIRLPLQPRPTRSARKRKSLAPLLFPDATWVIWLDANFSLQIPPEELVERYPGDVTCWSHHRRKRIVEECRAVIAHKVAIPERAKAQLKAYRSQGFDTDERPMRVLSQTGVMIRRNTPKVIEFSRAWWAQIRRWTLRDQMSCDFAAWRVGVEISHFDHRYREAPWVKHHAYQRPVNDY